jgi:hypothetical protein
VNKSITVVGISKRIIEEAVPQLLPRLVVAGLPLTIGNGSTSNCDAEESKD